MKSIPKVLFVCVENSCRSQMDLPGKCELPMTNAKGQEIGRLLKTANVVAVVGLSPNPKRPSHQVALYLQDQGYKIIPVRPGCAKIMGERCYPSLDKVPGQVDIVDVLSSAFEIKRRRNL